MNKRRLFFLFCLFFCLFSFPLNAEISFSGLDLAGDNRLLFRAAAAGASAQDALFITALPDPGGPENSAGEIRQLSAFPEKLDLLENGRTLQIRNLFGAFRVPLSGGLPAPVPGVPSFAGGNTAGAGEMIPSGDGRWLLYIDPVSPALGNLVLLDTLSGETVRAASRLDRPEKRFPAAWSPDSRFFIYERGGKLYYYMPGASPMPADERVRLIGDGTLSSISWGKGGDFFYLRGAALFRVRGAELFARAFYADFLEIGVLAGRIPFEFDPLFDEFWIAPDARSLLVSKGRRSLFYYPLDSGGGAASSETLLPYLLLPGFCSGINVLWSEAGTVTLFVSVQEKGKTAVKIYRLKPGEAGSGFDLRSLPGPGTGAFPSGSLSPDGKLALFWGEGGVVLYDYAEWKLVETVSARPGKACLWTGNLEFISGDDEKIERLTLIQSPAPGGGVSRTFIARRFLLCLSRVSEAGFEERSSRILAKSGSAWFVSDGKNPWAAAGNPRIRNSSQASAQYRVYLETQESGFYANIPMIRNTASVGTYPLFPPASGSPEGSPAGASRKAALCFDLYDDDRGLPETLDALKRFGIRATFFLNGEFIRRYPQAVLAIAEAGHEAASLFFAPINLSDTRYRAGPDFISRGLARNEDEYYRVTGEELALLWHPPWYAVSPEIAAAAAAAGYTTAGRDIDPLDWISREDETKFGFPLRSPSEMVDRIMEEVKPGAVIPIRLGLLEGGRNGYLFNRVNVLIEALLRDGYSLATVSEVLHTR